MCPWSEMYKAQKFAYKEFIVKEEDITYEKYCMFILTPFHRSMASIWVNEVTAYLIKKVLSTNDTSIGDMGQNEFACERLSKDSFEYYISILKNN